MTFVIISVLQLKVGKENKTLEVYFTGWMKSLSASKRIQNIAEGGQAFTSDVIKEFTTEDGSRIIITAPEVKRRMASEGKKLKQVLLKDNQSVSRFLQGLKLEVADLSEEAQETLKDEIRKEVLNEAEKKHKSLSSEAKALDNGGNNKSKN